MNSIITEEDLLKTTSKAIAGIIINRHQKLQERIKAGAFEVKFSMYDLIKDTKQVREKPTGTERS
ncbi:MAG TPA: hypothetical protein VKC54_03270 [Patescibacteria group bacterium]|nr:hypothetical protein [Patescibacteria group bacterium]